jgi:hypothetical protein
MPSCPERCSVIGFIVFCIYVDGEAKEAAGRKELDLDATTGPQ